MDGGDEGKEEARQGGGNEAGKGKSEAERTKEGGKGRGSEAGRREQERVRPSYEAEE